MPSIAWASCDLGPYRSVGWDTLADANPDLFIGQGDLPYSTSVGTFHGYTTTTPLVATTQAAILDQKRQFWEKPAAKRLRLQRGTGIKRRILFRDDHEQGGNNWDHTITQANDGGAGGIGAATQSDVNQHWARCNGAHRQFLAEAWDNPTPDSAGNTVFPSAATTGGASPSLTDYDICYFVDKFDVNGRLGTGAHYWVIYLDTLPYRSPYADSESAGKTVFGTQQEAWLQVQLQAAALARVPFVFISATKKLFQAASPENSDTIGGYTTAQARLLAMIAASGVQVVWLSGDRHNLHVMRTRQSSGAVCNMLDVCACPIGVDSNGVGAMAEKIWDKAGQGYGWIDIYPDRAEISLRDAVRGGVIWPANGAAATLLPFSNDPIYASRSASMRLGG